MKKYVLPVLVLLFASSLKAQVCSIADIPDLPLIPANATVQNEIASICTLSSNQVLGTSAPTAAQLNNAVTAYNNLNIVVNGSSISGNTIANYNALSFIGVFAQHLKFNPADANIITKANNTVWLTAQQVCNGTLYKDFNGYDFRNFGRKAAFCAGFLTSFNKLNLVSILEKNYGFNAFWWPAYDSAVQQANGVINSDCIYNNLEMMIPMVKCYTTNDEQYRYMRALHRYITRFISVYTVGTYDGLKPDGTAFHHNNNYEAYMYAYNTVITVLNQLDNTGFQLDAAAYKVFRDAFIHKYWIVNYGDVVPLSLTGRTGAWDGASTSQAAFKSLAILGGKILGLPTADPTLAGIYNRKYGVEPAFNYSGTAPFETGFYQMNHTNAGVFRSNGRVIVAKGFNNQFWGSEIYATDNRYGRYQSYGALTIVQPGNAAANGFDNAKWNWNYNPGATTKVLPWDKLIAGWNRLDEYSNKRFAGGLQFQLKHAGYLDNVIGTYGMFAMDFQEKNNLGFSGVTAADTHDPSFVFKKSAFFFDDGIICLASGIGNTDAAYNTVTTLYQNVTTPNSVIVNNNVNAATGSATTYPGSQDNWVLDNHSTGYYIVRGSGDITVQRKNQQTPSPSQTNPGILNPAAEAAIGYIDHGKAPAAAGYEYVVHPNTTQANMQNVVTAFSNTGTRPYEVLNKTASSHIIKHKATGIYAFALFDTASAIIGNTNIIANNAPCLIMYKPNALNTSMLLSLSNPDAGLPGPRSTGIYPRKATRITLSGQWQLAAPDPSIGIVSATASSTVVEFITYQGLPLEATFVKTANGPGGDGISVYPNPATGSVKLNMQVPANSFVQYKMYNQLGQIVLQGKLATSGEAINISRLSAGIYYLSIPGHHLKVVKF